MRVIDKAMVVAMITRILMTFMALSLSLCSCVFFVSVWVRERDGIGFCGEFDLMGGGENSGFIVARG